jgi:hypothetical protein
MPSLEGEMPLLLTDTAYGYLYAVTLGKRLSFGHRQTRRSLQAKSTVVKISFFLDENLTYSMSFENYAKSRSKLILIFANTMHQGKNDCSFP